MFHLLKTEWKKIHLTVLAATVILTIIACVLSCTLYQRYTLRYDLEAWEIGTEGFGFLYPLFVVIPLCWNLYYERKNNFMLYVLPRVPQKKYLTAKWLIYAISAFFILYIPYMLSALFALYVKAPIPVYIAGMYETPYAHVFLETFTQAPLLYAILLSIWRGFIGILIMTLGFVFAMYVKNIFVILTGPFVYAVLENFILAILRLEQYRLVVSFDPTSVSSHAVTLLSFITGPILLIITICAIILFHAKLKKHTVVTV